MKLTTIGWIYITLGALALIDVIWSAFHHKLSLNLAAFLIPVGIGLINKKESSFKWAIVWSYLLIAVSLIGFILVLIAKTPQMTDHNRILGIIIAGVLIGLFTFINRRLAYISDQTGIFVFSSTRRKQRIA